MICINELTDLKCNKKSILEPLVVLLSPYAPHVCEELWQYLGHNMSVTLAKFPEYNEANVAESEFNYPVSFNGKMRFMISLPIDMSNAEIEKMALSAPEAVKWLEDKSPKKVIVVPKKIINIVI